MVDNIPALGVSKKCCPVCRSILQALRLELGEPLGNLASHPQVFPSVFPPGLPGVVTERVVEEYRRLLKNELQQLTPRRKSSSMTSLAERDCNWKSIGQGIIRESVEGDSRGVVGKQG